MLFLSPILGGPELTVPSTCSQLYLITKLIHIVGQSTYYSKITNREEGLPVGISLLAAPGLIPFHHLNCLLKLDRARFGALRTDTNMPRVLRQT